MTTVDQSQRDPYQRVADQTNVKIKITAQEQIAADLKARIDRLERALEGIKNLQNINKLRDTFAADLIARMYEMPSVMKVNIYKNDWSGAAASSFADSYQHTADRLTAMCEASYAFTRSFRTEIAMSDLGLNGAAIAIQARLAEVKNELVKVRANLINLNSDLKNLQN